jgi:hypothetical protein
MKVTIQYFDGDPNWPTARDRVREVLDDVGQGSVEIELQRIGTPEEAHQFRFRGSPTILVDGEDRFDSEESGYGLMSRIYRTEAGTDIAPSKLQLRDALSPPKRPVT